MKTKNKESLKFIKKYFVSGMHCASCEIIIKQDIQEIKGVEKVFVSLNENSVEITTNGQNTMPSVQQLNKTFANHGYKFYEEKIQFSNNKKDFFKITFISLFLIILFFLADKLGIFYKFSLNNNSSYISYFLFGIAAGLSSCAALVGGLLLSLSKKWNETYNLNSKKSFLPFIYFNISRILFFGIFGGILGLLGSYLIISITVGSFLTISVSILMILIGLQMLNINFAKKISLNFIGNHINFKNQTNLGKYFPIVIGALTFFIPCGFTLIAQTNTLTAGDFMRGFFQMLFFALGTLPILALISFSSVKLYANPKLSKSFSYISGILIIFFAFYNINSQLNVLGLFSFNDLSKINNSKDKKVSSESNIEKTNELQLIQMEAKGFEYYPKQITIKSGIKTKWEIYDSGSYGCAKAVYARGLYSKVIYLIPGLNSVEFVAPKPGTYKISCSMGMVDPIIVTVL